MSRNAIRRSQLKRVVPVTALRRLYDLLRITSGTVVTPNEVHLAMVREFRRRPALLQQMIDDSFRHFTFYENEDEPFQSARSNEIAGDGDERRLIRAIKERRHVVGDAERFGCDYVANHVYPSRTTGSEDESGRSPAPGYALDLLMTHRQDRAPIIGEIKCCGDTNPFFGLIQGLNYALELSTPSQQRRLRRWYPDCFAEPRAGANVDVYLILIGHDYPDDAWMTTILEETDGLSNQLVAQSTSAGRFVRRIVCLKARASGSDGAETFKLETVFAHG